jgi:hypothetical protein
MNKIYLSFIFLLCYSLSYSQKEANIMPFDNYQLDFNNGAPVIKSEFAMHLRRGIGSICDSNGAILFYSDGFSIWNKTHQLMPNGTNLIPFHGSTSTQESIVIPIPHQKNKFYLFTTDPWNGQSTSGLYYSLIDLSLDNGNGDVISKGVKLLDDTTNKITATYHENSEDIWLLTHHHNSNKYYSFKIGSNGISNNVIINEIGVSHSFWGGQLKFSPNGKKVVCARSYDYVSNTVVDIFDFDRATGILSETMSFDLPAQGRNCEGAEFSSNSNKLYVVQGGSSHERGLYQFDLSSNNIFDINNSITLIHREEYNGFRQLQLGPNEKIYITKGGGGGGTQHLGVITNINESVTSVQVEENGLFLNGNSSFVNFTPNFIQNTFHKPTDVYLNDDCIILFPDYKDTEISVSGELASFTIDILDSTGTIIESLIDDVNFTKWEINSIPNGPHFIRIVSKNAPMLSMEINLKN